MEEPKEFLGKIEFIRELNYRTLHCRIRHIEPKSLEFEPGQHFVMYVNESEKRAYSIGSSASENRFIDTYVDLSPGGVGSKFFSDLKEGDEVEYMAPKGRFLYEKGDDPILFTSTGTGIVPFLSMIEYALDEGETRKMHLLQGFRYMNDIYLEERLTELSLEHENFSFDFCLSREESEGWEGNRGRITDFIPEKIVDLGKNTIVYTCGAKVVVNDVIKLSKELGLPREQIKYEKY